MSSLIWFLKKITDVSAQLAENHDWHTNECFVLDLIVFEGVSFTHNKFILHLKHFFCQFRSQNRLMV